MAMSLASQIRDRLAHYLDGSVSLQEFDAWLVPSTWNVEQTRDRDAIDLTYEIVLRLAEFSNGDCAEPELKALLRPLVLARSGRALTA